MYSSLAFDAAAASSAMFPLQWLCNGFGVSRGGANALHSRTAYTTPPSLCAKSHESFGLAFSQVALLARGPFASEEALGLSARCHQSSSLQP